MQCHRELNKHPQLGQRDPNVPSLVTSLNVWGWKRMKWLCHHYLESGRNAWAKLGLSALSSSNHCSTNFLTGPLTRQTIQASYHDQLRSTCFLTSPPIVLFPSLLPSALPLSPVTFCCYVETNPISLGNTLSTVLKDDLFEKAKNDIFLPAEISR